MYDYEIRDGVAHLGPRLSELERRLFRAFEQRLLNDGFDYLSIPSSVSWDGLNAQEVVSEGAVLGFDEDHCLGGSAEQGILDRFSGQEVEPQLLFAENFCWRNESDLDGLKTLKEFRKLEQFAFVEPDNWRSVFTQILHHGYDFLNQFDELEVRVIDCTDVDEGYHHVKYDIEVKTEQYGWMETHSCSYFADEQVKRFGIEGGVHTISNTGLASPRVLIPFIEAGIGPDKLSVM